MPSDQVIAKRILRKLAENGHAPEEGCERFGVGYDDVFDRLIKEYVRDRFDDGESGMKFVIGPYGSGKTHFLRQMMALVRNQSCVTIEVQLNKQLDYAKPLLVYREVARAIRAPGQRKDGISDFLQRALENVVSRAPDGASPEAFQQAWVRSISQQNYELREFGQVVQSSLEAYAAGETSVFETTSRWIAGEIDNKEVVKALPDGLLVQPVKSAEHALFAGKMMLSLFQFVRIANFCGTVVGFDEAEQGMSVNRKRQQVILSMLQSEINELADLQGGSVLILFALTPDVAERFDEFAALQQRIEDPGPGMGFFDGNTLAPRIDLTQRVEPATELAEIGRRLADLFVTGWGRLNPDDLQDVRRDLDSMAQEIAEHELSSSSRRTMVKRAATYLLNHRGETPKAANEPEA